MPGNEEQPIAPEDMTSAELHAHFSKILVGCAQDVDSRFADVNNKLTDTIDKLEGIEASFTTKFQEVLARLPVPTPPPVAPRPHAHATAVG